LAPLFMIATLVGLRRDGAGTHHPCV